MPPTRQGQLPVAHKIFVDREAPQKMFEDAAFAIPGDRSVVLVFYGVGGQGKTALCREFMRKTNVEVEPSYGFLRRAELDLHGRSKEDADRLLVWIRNGFADAGVVFPCFDLTFAITWEATRGEEPIPKFTKPWLARTTALGESGVDKVSSFAKDWLTSDDAKELIGDFVNHIPGVGFILKRIGHWAIEKGKRVYLEWAKDALKEIYRDGEIRRPYELSQLLPWMLAQDLNKHLSTYGDRFALFIDEYERVFDEGGAGSVWEDNPFDSHIRRLITETNGLLVVFFSREQLPWGSNPDWRDTLNYSQHLLGGLAAKDADVFLQAVPIEDLAIRQAIITGARETSWSDSPIYPLMLDLQVEHWRTLKASSVTPTPSEFRVTAQSFEGRRIEIVGRVLRDYGSPLETTIERLSVARRFDRMAFDHVVQTFGTALPLDHFERVADLSFVTRSPDGFLTIHNVIAETIRETLTPEKRATSVDALFRHFEERAKVATAREVTDDTVAALIEAAFLRLAQGVKGYVAWLSQACDAVRIAARYANVISLWREAVEVTETQLGDDDLDTATSLNNLALFLEGQGDFAGARSFYERALAIYEKVLGPNHANAVICLNNLAGVLAGLGDFAGAQALYERARAICEEGFGLKDPHTAITLNNFALLLQTRGDFAGARALYESALAINEEVLGSAHADTATSLNNLGGLLQIQGDLGGARALYERALAIYEKVHGSDHRETATGLNNFARLLNAQGDVAGARPLYERALAIREKILGPDHPDTATSLNNLATLLEDQGDLADAKALYERALAIREKVFGPDHPDTATSLNNLATLLEDQGDLADAKALYERALAIQEKVFGPDHPDTAQSLNNLAHLLKSQNDLAGARPLYERALAIREKVLGPDHPKTAQSANNLGLLLKAQGDLTGARALHERALAIREKVLGLYHPITGVSFNNLAGVVEVQGDLAGAQALYERALAISEKVFGTDHADTATSLNNLAGVLRAQNDLAGARPLYERALAIFVKVLGPDHPDTATSLNNLAGVLRAQSDLAGARGLYERGMAIREKVLGPDHPDTATSLNNLAGVLRAQGDLAGARGLYERALAIREKVLGPDHPDTTISVNNLLGLLWAESNFTGAHPS